MKKLVFSISLILSYTFIAIAGVVKSIPAKADEFTSNDIVTVTPSISQTDLNKYNNALQVLEYLRQGGTIDFSNVSDGYQTGDLLDEFVDLIDTVGSGIDYYGNNFLDNIFNLSSDTVQLSPNYKLKDRIGQFRSNLPSYLNNQDDNTPSVNPDPNYASYLDSINGSGFWWKYRDNVSNEWNGIISYGMNRYPMYMNTWYSNSANIQTYETYIPEIYAIPIQSIYITSVDNTYYINQYIYFSDSIGGFNSWQSGTYWNYQCYRGQIYSSNIFGLGPTSDNNIYINYSGTLENCLLYLKYRFRNINIYVDGNLWSYVGQGTSYHIGLNTGTYLVETNQPIEYKFEIPVYVDISDLIDKIQLAIDNKITLDFPYLNDLIVDTNGQQTIAVTVFSEDYTIDDLYVKDYGAMIPLFPLWVEYPVALEHINTVATVGIVDVIPADIIEVLGIFLIVGLFVFLCHRLME